MLDRAKIPPIVLIVEDDMILRMRSVDIVEDAGYTPVEAVDADEALGILQSRRSEEHTSELQSPC